MSHEFPFSLDDFAPGSNKASLAGTNYHTYTGNISLAADSLTPGLYYATGNIHIYQNSSADLDLSGVTVVAGGSIALSGSNVTLSPWDPDGVTLYAHSNGSPNCYSSAIELSTSQLDFEGILAAPNGKVGLFTSTTSAVQGHIISYSAQVTGNNLVMTLP